MGYNCKHTLDTSTAVLVRSIEIEKVSFLLQAANKILLSRPKYSCDQVGQANQLIYIGLEHCMEVG